MRLSSSEPPVGGVVEVSPYEDETYIVLVVGKNSRAFFSKPCGYAHEMHERQMLARFVVQI
jgi:hypothetical protein